MIKLSNELRIGNYILGGSGLLIKVAGIAKDPCFGSGLMQAIAEQGGEYTLDYCNPIPLTEEWLKRCGFSVVEKKGSNAYFKVYTKEPLTFNTNHGWWLRNAPFENNHLEYVHQLQNLYFALTGEELTIKE